MRNKKVLFKTPRALVGVGLVSLLVLLLPPLSDYRDFFIFAGSSFLLAGIISLFFHPKTAYWDVSETLKIPAIKQSSSEKQILKMPFTTKQSPATLLFLIIIGGFLINQLLLAQYNAKSNINEEPVINTTKTSLSAIDQSLLAELQQRGKELPVLGTAHTHADLNIYINGERLILAKQENYMKSSFMHLDNNQNPDDANSVLHMHAKKVPLWLFFRSLGINLTKDSLTLTNGRILKNENGNTLKFYLDGKRVDDLSGYSFQPLDKLLISYGPENDENVNLQIKSMTDFAKNYQK